MNELTTKLKSSGIEVLAKEYEGMILPVTYGNRTQAQKKAARLGDSWMVYKGSGRPFYVAKREEDATEALGFASIAEMENHAAWIEEQHTINARVRQAVEDSKQTGIVDLTWLAKRGPNHTKEELQ